jgi:predicted esterase
MIMIHGRGASAADILGLAGQFHQSGFAYQAPQARNDAWYPYRFMEPLENNEPWLSSALDVIARLIHRLDGQGLPSDRVILLGFSQGACLATEYAARFPQRYGGIVGLSGGLIGPDGTPRPDPPPGLLDSTPVFLGCSDVDPHIPKSRVEHTAQVLSRLGGKVTTRLYPGMGHTVNEDELGFVESMMGKMLKEMPTGD